MPTQPSAPTPRFQRFPVVSLGAEFLVMGNLMRRNIPAYKAPPNNEGYDLVCIHPDPRTSFRPVRVQVKSRLATDCDRAFPVKERTFGAFDYLIVVFLNVGNFFARSKWQALGRGHENLSSPPFPPRSSKTIMFLRQRGKRCNCAD